MDIKQISKVIDVKGEILNTDWFYSDFILDEARESLKNTKFMNIVNSYNSDDYIEISLEKIFETIKSSIISKIQMELYFTNYSDNEPIVLRLFGYYNEHMTNITDNFIDRKVLAPGYIEDKVNSLISENILVYNDVNLFIGNTINDKRLKLFIAFKKDVGNIIKDKPYLEFPRIWIYEVTKFNETGYKNALDNSILFHKDKVLPRDENKDCLQSQFCSEEDLQKRYEIFNEKCMVCNSCYINELLKHNNLKLFNFKNKILDIDSIVK